MSLTITELFTPLTTEQVVETILTSLETIGLPARSWRQGGALRVIIVVLATLYAGFTQVASAFIQSGFLETAVGGWLTLLARNVYGVEREPASFASADLTLVNGGGGSFTEGIGEISVKNPATGKVYTNTEAFTLLPSETATVAFQAVEVGSASSTAPGTITEFVTAMLGVTVTNETAFVGSDAQGDADLKAACRAKLGALSLRGPRGAYEYAVSVALRNDGSPVDINRVSISAFSSTGIVDVYCASPSGAPVPSDLDDVAASIELYARPDTVTVNVLAVTEVPVAEVLTVYARRTPGLSSTDLQTQIDGALINAIKSYPIGGLPTPPSAQGYLYGDFIAGTVKAVHPSIYHVTGQVDVLLNAGEVAVLAQSALTVRITDVP